MFEKAGIDWRDIQKNGWTWTRFETEMRRITAMRRLPEYTGREIYGTLLQIWPDTLRNIIWTYGGDFFKTDTAGKPDFRTLALDSPPAQAAMEMIARMRLKERTAFNAS